MNERSTAVEDEPILLVGAGGHAKVVIAAIRAAGQRVLGLLDDREARHGESVMGCQILGGTELLGEFSSPAVIAIGSNAARARLSREWADVRWATVVHPTAWLAPGTELGPGSVIFAGCVIQPETRIGAHCIVNTGASVDHDCVLGDYVHIGPGARLSGSVTVGNGVFAGIGSCIIPGRKVGAWTTIGAGGAVVKDIPRDVVAVGVPARPIKELNDNWHLE